ncbi:MAG: hypothetical protein M3015_08930 [Bacteroidota bacterium]|nr:hypothetical protein [Bacteroidota bacterium]
MTNIISKTFKAGLLVGTLDISAAFLQSFIKTGKGPAGVLKYIASGAFGNAAFSGGAGMIICGLLFHYIIAIFFTFFFFLIFAKLYSALKSKFLIALLYGVFMWAFMKFIVVPLSATPKFPFDWTNAVIGIAILIICISLPLSFIAYRYENLTDKKINN